MPPSPAEGPVPLLAPSPQGPGRGGASGWSLPLCPLNKQSALSRPPPGPAEPGLCVFAFSSFQFAESWAPLVNFQDPFLGVLWPGL